MGGSKNLGRSRVSRFPREVVREGEREEREKTREREREILMR